MKAGIFLLLLTASLMAQNATLKVDVRMIEVYASVADDGGRPVTNLQAQDFRVYEDERLQQIRIFEPQSTAMTLALLVDTTASMNADLPRVKNAVARLLTTVRREDTVGLFTFANGLNTLSDFSRDRNAVLSAILKTRAAGNTAMFDSLAQLSRRISKAGGKKAILLFTDGDDNSSVLSMEASIKDVQRIGVPVYAILYGRALTNAALNKRLEQISTSTGGIPFKVEKLDELSNVFARVGQDLQHMYLLGYQPDVENTAEWRAVKVTLPGHPKLKLRTKEGYWR